ncbi:sigma-54-dependent Fis family transcriptional regulator [uncultured Alistipes sp.]|jgi:transcriptional regulator with PAS, ATPase and Fis domain|uniref:sigma-54 interaction domain-containing protein n=1 Tax=Alistipes sp. TaxID=1872444 RepID=UPI0025DA278C|nr:sigma-54 dependent transcriptional regulator [uncultured Alistipes sp.]
MTDITTVKQRFGIIGTSELLDRALEVAVRVAPTDLTVLVTGESGVGKEFFPQVIHAYSARKHNKYIAVNCAAIPEGTIDSELFGHEKGSFTGALEARKGYFEEADGGTIFLDEVAELPHPTQARLLRVLQTGEFIRVGSSKVQKTDVRVVAATNMNLQQAIASGRFREDLYYRLSTVPIIVPALRERPQDIPLLFRKFAADVAVQYRMPVVTLDAAAREMLMRYYWRGNIRQLKNVAEQISAIEQARLITPDVLARYLPPQGGGAPAPMGGVQADDTMSSERELLYKVLFDMRADINDLKRMMSEMMHNVQAPCGEPVHDIKALLPTTAQSSAPVYAGSVPVFAESEEVTDEPPREMTKADMQREQIVRALRRNNGRRREAAAELFMSERTLYRKIKELGIEEE